MRQNFFRARGFEICLFVLVLLKLWLIHADEIVVSVESYDASWYLTAAKHWYWGAPYDRMAFIRPPGYPLWIAFVHLFGFPQRIAIELLQVGGLLALVAGLRKSGLPRAISLLVFAAMIFHPAAFQLNNWARSDVFYAGMLWAGLGGLLLTACTARVWHAIWTGFVFSILWNTREESSLLLLILGMFFGFAWLQNYFETQSWKLAGSRLAKPTTLLASTMAIVCLSINAANFRSFHSFAKSEVSSSSFKAAYKALLRIKPAHASRFVPISSEARQLGYSVSPTFARLQPLLEGEVGGKWRQVSFERLHVPNEIAAGWFPWALREAAERVGAHRSGEVANRFYRMIAKEINYACDRGRIPSRFVFSSFIDPAAFDSLGEVPRSFLKITQLFLQPYQIRRARDIGVIAIDPAQRALYDEMANRRVALSAVGTIQIIGSAFRRADPIKLIVFRDANGEIEAATDRFLPEPDLAKHFSLQGTIPSETRFVLPIPLRRSRAPTGDLVFFTQSGAKFSGPIAAVLAGKPPTAQDRAHGEELLCWIRSQKLITPKKENVVAVENLIGKYYRFFVIGLSYLGVVALVVLLACVRRLRWKDPLYAALLLLAVTIASRVALFSFLDATSWPGDEPRYSFPVMPLYSAFLIVLIYQASTVANEAIASRSRGRTSAISDDQSE